LYFVSEIHFNVCLSGSLSITTRHDGVVADTINQSINQSIYLANCATTNNKCQQNNVKHSDGIPEKQIAHLRAPK